MGRRRKDSRGDPLPWLVQSAAFGTAEFRGWKVPDVLLNGSHEEIRRFRQRIAREKTRRLRPTTAGHLRAYLEQP
ncbi:MAG: hypothetical protein ACLQU1_03145 [Bryobacteraceae bacterium]